MIKLKSPSAPFLSTLAMPERLGPVARRAWRRSGEEAYRRESRSASGAFTVKEWRRGDRVILEEEPEFLGGGPREARRRRVDLGARRQHPHAERAGRRARHRDLRAVLARRGAEEGPEPHRPSRPLDPRGSSADQPRARRARQEGSAPGARHGDRQAGDRRHRHLRPRRGRQFLHPEGRALPLCRQPAAALRPGEGQGRCWPTPAPPT